MSGSDWYNYCDSDFDDDSYDVKRRRNGSSHSSQKVEWAKEVLRVSNECHYGGYVYDYGDRKEARRILRRG